MLLEHQAKDFLLRLVVTSLRIQMQQTYGFEDIDIIYQQIDDSSTSTKPKTEKKEKKKKKKKIKNGSIPMEDGSMEDGQVAVTEQASEFVPLPSSLVQQHDSPMQHSPIQHGEHSPQPNDCTALKQSWDEGEELKLLDQMGWENADAAARVVKSQDDHTETLLTPEEIAQFKVHKDKMLKDREKMRQHLRSKFNGLCKPNDP